ncbi:hypothetical protein ABGB19_03335 [Mycobacterium sp. B14F4]|uniref:hypothetical protein n=1 Tax=Mycobacterium sp. B14F4 TaxID=3153565 RepID=UPI00325CA2D3
MPKRSPWERYHKQQRAIDAKVFHIVLSSNHPCRCGHVQGFHWSTDDGENLGKCADAECPCEAFDEDTFTAAQLAAGVLPTTTAAAAEQDDGKDDALRRAMRAEEQREVSAEEAWDRAMHTDRPRTTGKPRRSTLDDPAAMDALRQLGGSPDDLAG